MIDFISCWASAHPIPPKFVDSIKETLKKVWPNEEENDFFLSKFSSFVKELSLDKVNFP